MKICTASKTTHAEKWRKLRNEHSVTASWIHEIEKGHAADFSELAIRCITDIQSADCPLLYCEPGELLKGTLIESGIALACGKEVRWVGECANISCFYQASALARIYNS